MVELALVTASNARFTRANHEGQVCVFAGATTGIGLGTLRRLSTMLQSSTFYILGRGETKFGAELQRLRAAAPTCTFVFIETQVSLISSVDAASATIAADTQKIDYLCVSPGGMPFQGAVYTKEGLEECLTISYYARLRLITNLMPLLRRSAQPRVLSILNGTKEKRINEADLGLDQQWSIFGVVNQTTICTSLAFDLLALKDTAKQLTLIHATPGLVHTGTPRKRYPSTKDGYIRWAFLSVVQIIFSWIIVYFGFPLHESGERHAFLLTSDRYTPGSLRTDQFNEIVADNDALRYYKENGWMEIIWEHTLRIWNKALTHHVL